MLSLVSSWFSSKNTVLRGSFVVVCRKKELWIQNGGKQPLTPRKRVGLPKTNNQPSNQTSTNKQTNKRESGKLPLGPIFKAYTMFLGTRVVIDRMAGQGPCCFLKTQFCLAGFLFFCWFSKGCSRTAWTSRKALRSMRLDSLLAGGAVREANGDLYQQLVPDPRGGRHLGGFSCFRTKTKAHMGVFEEDRPRIMLRILLLV